jgi:GDP-4-dehydro-6-deoxy-D-mannose reductase
MSDHEILLPREEQEQSIRTYNPIIHRLQTLLYCIAIICFCIATGWILMISLDYLEHQKSHTRRYVDHSDAVVFPRPIGITTVFITGINGMIGSHTTRELLRSPNKYMIYGLIRPHSDLYNLLDIQHNLTLLIGDITDSYRMLEIIRMIQCPDYLYHFAAQSINGISDHNPELTLHTNVDGTHHLLEALVYHHCWNRTIFVFASSSTVYGKSADTVNIFDGQSLSEDTPLQPVSLYGTSKLAGEALCTQYDLTHRIKTIRIRFFIQIGPGGTDSLSIQHFAKQIATLETLGNPKGTIHHGNLDTYRDISDITQTAPLVIQIAERGQIGEVYNLGSGHSVHIKHLLTILIQFTPIIITLEQDTLLLRSYDEKNLVADLSHIQRDLNMIAYPEMNLRETLLNILEDWRHRLDITNSYSVYKPLSPIPIVYL